MFDILVASKPRRQARPGAIAVAALTHVFVLGLCVVGTRAPVRKVAQVVDDTTLIFLPRLEPAAVDQPVPRAGRGGPGGAGGEGGVLILSANPPPRGFQSVGIVASVPTSLPPVNADERILDPRDFTGRGVEGGVGWGVVGGTGSPDQPMPEGAPGEMLYAAEFKDVRFSPAELVIAPSFTYPRMLREAAIPGRVELQFIVDTTGLVEPGSVVVLATTHEAFTESAKEGLLLARFQPARYGDLPVRQLSRLPVNFRIRTERTAG